MLIGWLMHSQRLWGHTVSQNEAIKKVSIVIPVYNEQESLPALIARTSAACQQLTQPYEIILVDDGSNDSSGDILTAAANEPDSCIIAVLLNRNYGQHSAIMAGFNQVSGDLVITLDADLQNPPEEIPRLVTVAEEGYDVVGTVRSNRQDSLFRKTASRMINMMIQRATGKSMGDYGCMLRAYRRHIVEAMLHCHERSTFIPILANTFGRAPPEEPPYLYSKSTESLLSLLSSIFAASLARWSKSWNLSSAAILLSGLYSSAPRPVEPMSDSRSEIFSLYGSIPFSCK